MSGSNFFNPQKKSAQQIVEFALVVPFFIILFCFAVQIMAAAFSKYRFSYIFLNAVKNAVQYQPVFTSKDDAASYDFRQTVQNSVEYALESGAKLPYTSVKTEIVIGPKVSYVIGGVNFNEKLIFFGSTGEEYFYSILPLSSAFIEPLILNITSDDLTSFFEEYYSTSGSNNQNNEAMEASLEE